MKYTIRTLSIPGHPFAELYKNYYHFQFYKDCKSLLPVVGRAFELFNKYKLFAEMFNSYPLEHRSGHRAIKTRTSLVHESQYRDSGAVNTNGSVKE